MVDKKPLVNFKCGSLLNYTLDVVVMGIIVVNNNNIIQNMPWEMLYEKYVNICIPQSMKLGKWAILRLLQVSHRIEGFNMSPEVLWLNRLSMLFMLLDPVSVQSDLGIRVMKSSHWDFRNTMWMCGKNSSFGARAHLGPDPRSTLYSLCDQRQLP